MSTEAKSGLNHRLPEAITAPTPVRVNLVPGLKGGGRLKPWFGMAAAVLAAGIAALLYGHALVVFGLREVTPSVMLAVFVSAVISSTVGFAFSAICGAILLHLVESPAAAVQIMLVCSIGIQSFSVWVMRRHMEWESLPRVLLGGLMGLPAGLWLLLHLNRISYASTLGILLMLYGFWMLSKRTPSAWRPGRNTGVVAGFLGGITGGMAALPGPFVTIWCNLQGWSKARQRGLTQPFILVMQLLTLAALHTGPVNPALPATVALSVWAYLPCALVGTWIGLSVFRHLSERQFTVAVNLLLIISGFGLIL